jgi:hypothetical protein
LNAYAEQATLTSHTMERLEHENINLRHETRESTEVDLELQTVYRCLSEAEHGWHFTHQQLDLAREAVGTCTHAIMHLENAVEMRMQSLRRGQRLSPTSSSNF